MDKRQLGGLQVSAIGFAVQIDERFAGGPGVAAARTTADRPTDTEQLARRDTMEVEARQPTGKGPAERFTGDVWVDPVAQPRPVPHRMTAALVRFAPGSRTAWHVHALGQTLRVTDGIALVQARGGDAVAVHPGETVYTAPGEWHWHGATDDSFMTHLALSETPPVEEAPAVTWGDHVTDTEYQAAHQALRGENTRSYHSSHQPT
jgi:quercetin dioxygenase-like cupin family protein